MNKPTNCPKCDSKRVKRIVYGLIRLSVWEYFLPRDWVAGGCSVKDDSANWYCAKCEYCWGKYQEEDLE